METIAVTKKCFKCEKEKHLSAFYKHKQMLDGYLNKCKECTKQDAKCNYRKNVIHYKVYDKLRNKVDKRKKYKQKSLQKFPPT